MWQTVDTSPHTPSRLCLVFITASFLFLAQAHSATASERLDDMVNDNCGPTWSYLWLYNWDPKRFWIRVHVVAEMNLEWIRENNPYQECVGVKDAADCRAVTDRYVSFVKRCYRLSAAKCRELGGLCRG